MEAFDEILEPGRPHHPRVHGPQDIFWNLDFFRVPTFNVLNVGTVPTFSVLNVGTVPTFSVLNVGTVPTFKPSQILYKTYQCLLNHQCSSDHPTLGRKKQQPWSEHTVIQTVLLWFVLDAFLEQHPWFCSPGRSRLGKVFPESKLFFINQSNATLYYIFSEQNQ